ncbi:hypothetical protein BKA61DRAFT_716306 [Leptodontidium sp. MPI-SDFR-AT-0119]|nr:hypothetical protein BKA61DRAFT_716306 [Leptodontidium sp. MPI-SDFR-AT-0119]
MTRTNPADEVPKRSWVLDEDGRWTLNPAVVQVTHEMMRCLVSLKKFDAGWESFGPNAIQQFYNLMGMKDHLEDSDGNVFQFHEVAFKMPEPTPFSRDLYLQFFGLSDKHGPSQKLPKVSHSCRNLLLSDYLERRKSTSCESLESTAKDLVQEEPEQTSIVDHDMYIRLCALTLRYFRLWPKKTQDAAELDNDSQKPTNVLSRLPVELQMEILEKLSLAEMDRSIRGSFQDLTHLHFSTLKFRSKRFFMDLCSRENFAYAGTWYSRDLNEINEVYRLKYPNLHPNLQPCKYDAGSQDTPIADLYDPPSLSSASFLLMTTLEHLAWQRGHPNGNIREYDKIWRTNKRSRALAFALDPDDSSTANFQPQSRRTKHTLLIYQDELNLILDELDPYFRPTFLAHQMVGLDPNIIDAPNYNYTFPYLEWPECKITRKLLLWDPTTTGGIERSSFDGDESVSWWEADRIKQLSVMVLRIKLK